MKLISHRGNINGPDPLNENNPDYIEAAISMGFDVEVDIRHNDSNDTFYLGHDHSQYPVNWIWLAKNMNHLWIHCKNIEALYKFTHYTSGYNYFWHQEDNFTLTSKNYIWTYPGYPFTSKSVIVMPEWCVSIDELKKLNTYDCYAICSDYVENLNV
jgi:hypothetical protein